jgi:hypothetical protein
MRPAPLSVLVFIAVSSSAVALGDEALKKRPLPDYDGRGEEPTSAGDVLVYVPRIVLFPAYLVSEYVFRRPFEWLIVNAERGQWPTLILDFFTFEDRKVGVLPTALFDFGFRPSVGLYVFWDDAFFAKNGVRFSASTGGSNYFGFHLTDRVKLPEENGTLSASFDFLRRPDWRFQGVGPEFPSDTLARYRSDRIEGLLRYQVALVDQVSFSLQTGVRRVTFDEGGCCDDPTISDLLAAGRIPSLPPGFGTDYTVYHHGIEVAFDTRRPRPANGSGLRFELGADQSFGLTKTVETPFLNYGGAIGGFWDVAGLNRILSLFLITRFIDNTSRGVVPFTELSTIIGGAGVMPGFRSGRLIGRSAIAAQLEYRWPIWVWLDGAMHFAVGNVFGPHLQRTDPMSADNFELQRLRASFGLGMRTVGQRDQSFNAMFALGTDTFERGFSVTDVRFVVGTQRGF